MGKEPVEHMMHGTARVETAAYSIQQWLSLQHTEDHMLSLGSVWAQKLSAVINWCYLLRPALCNVSC